MEHKRRILFIGEASFIATGFGTYWQEVIKRLYETDEFEIAELGGYASDGDPKIQSVPWKFYPVQPNANDTRAQQIFRSKPTFQFGEWRFDDVCIDFKPDIVCVPPGTKIETPHGQTNIENIKDGDWVLSHTGKPRKVLANMRRQHVGEMIKIYPHNDNMCYEFTPEHPILAIRSKKRTWKQRDVQQRHNIDDAKFVEAKDLCKGDYLLVPIYRPTEIKANIDITVYLKQFVEEDGICYPNGHVIYQDDNGIPRFINLTQDFARLLGYYCAEGSPHNGGIQFTFNINEIEYQKDVSSIIQNLFGLTCKIDLIDNVANIRCNSVLLKHLFTNWCGAGAHNKKVPEFIYCYNNDHLVKSFLEAYIKGDGCYKPDTVSCCTVSEILARQVRQLFARLGCKTSIVKGVSRGNELVSFEGLKYDVECYGQSARLAHKFINKKEELPTRSQEYPKWQNKGSVGWITDDYIVVPIRRIRKKDYRGQVYNISVAQENTYVTGFAVHNCGIRDWWMDEFVLRSPFRKYFKFLWQPTIDGEPQKEMWLDSYKQCDGILTYSEYGMNLLKKTGRPDTNLLTIASPGADIEVFKPPVDKREHKKRLGIDPDAILIGTVMRNQKRKLYKDLIEAFSMWVHKAKSKGHANLVRKTFLYLHTSYPDVGYDIGSAIKEFKISNKVIMTYLCAKCGTAFPARFSGSTMNCIKCSQPTAHPPNASHQCPRHILADIMKSFDLYVQYSICEGYGMPLTEAQACGVPTMAVDYSAMQDHLQNPTSIPIDVGRFFYEAIIETEQKRALPNNQDFVNKLDRFVKLSDQQRQHLNDKTREYIVEPTDTYGSDKQLPRRSWERTAAIWHTVLTECEIHDNTQTWGRDIAQIYKPDLKLPKKQLTNGEFIKWVIGSIWNRPDMVGTFFAAEWLTALNLGFKTENGQRFDVNRQKILDYFLNLIENVNKLEQRRVYSLDKINPDKIGVIVI